MIMDIANIIRSLPKVTKLYSPAFGNVELTDVDNNGMIRVWTGAGHKIFFCNGHYSANGECMLFPSADNRDWGSFKTTKFDVKTLKPFDAVLTRREDNAMWIANLFSHLSSTRNDKFVCVSQHHYVQCVLFNDETKHLLGTTESAPDFYNTWD